MKDQRSIIKIRQVALPAFALALIGGAAALGLIRRAHFSADAARIPVRVSHQPESVSTRPVARPLAPAASVPQSSSSFDQPQNVVSNGGGSSSSGGDFESGGTAGQVVAGPAMSGGDFSVTSGFWQPQFAPPSCTAGVGTHGFNQVVNGAIASAPPMSVSTGSSIYVAMSVGSSRTVTSVTDNSGNTYAKATSTANGPIETEIWYFDNVAASANLIVTANLSGNGNATIEAVEIKGAANPSLDSSGTNTGHSLIAGASANSSVASDFALLSVVSPNSGNQSFSAVNPDVIIDASPAPVPGGQNIAGADLGEQLGASGSYTLSANVTGHGTAPVDWAATVVMIKLICSPTPPPMAPTITKAFGAANIPLNGSTSLTFTIQNQNSGTTLTGVGFSDTLPAGLIISTPNGLSGSCGGGTITATQNTNLISLSGASLAANSSCTFSVNVTGTQVGVQTNVTGNVTSNEGGQGGTATASVTVCSLTTITCPASITKFADSGQLGATINPGTPVTSGGCNPVTVSGVRSDGKPLNALYPIGLTMITWTAKDGSGNTVSCIQTIVIMTPSGQRRRP